MKTRRSLPQPQREELLKTLKARFERNMVHLGRRLKAMALQDTRLRNDGLRALTWTYKTEGPIDEPSAEDVLREINGWSAPDHKQLAHIKDLKNDGSTACGACTSRLPHFVGSLT